jgi:hypothetical protein
MTTANRIDTGGDWPGFAAPGDVSRPPSKPTDPVNVADRYADLLSHLPREKHAGLIARISQGFYDGWRPSRGEVADLVAVELRLLTIDECIERQRHRRFGREPAKNLIPIVVTNGQYH